MPIEIRNFATSCVFWATSCQLCPIHSSDFLSKNSEEDIIFFQKKNKVKLTFKEDLDYGVNDYKLEFKLKSNKIIETIQSEKIIKSETNIIKFEDRKKKKNKSFVKKTKKKYYKNYKKKTK